MANKDLFTVYMHKAPNGKYYIGMTRMKVSERWYKDGKGYQNQKLFWKAIQKYGWDNFEHIIIKQNLSEEEASNLEIELIAKYNSTDRRYGYNISTGGYNAASGVKRSDEYKKRLSESMKGRPAWNKGIPMSEESKKHLSEINTGKKVSDVTRQKMKDNNARYWKGKTHSEETRKKISQKSKGRVSNRKGVRLSEESKRKISEKQKLRLANKDLSGQNNGFYGKHHTVETIEKIRKASIENNARRRKEKEMSVNRGKQFENVIKKCFSRVPGVSIDRMHDQMTRYKGSQNICDFIVYKEPYEYYIECKSVHGNTLPFSNISEVQWKGLSEKSKIPGVFAGVICWWIDKDITKWIPIQALESFRFNGCKSIRFDAFYRGFSVDNVNRIALIEGQKKRVFFDYDMEQFFKEVGGK